MLIGLWEIEHEVPYLKLSVVIGNGSGSGKFEKKSSEWVRIRYAFENSPSLEQVSRFQMRRIKNFYTPMRTCNDAQSTDRAPSMNEAAELFRFLGSSIFQRPIVLDTHKRSSNFQYRII